MSGAKNTFYSRRNRSMVPYRRRFKKGRGISKTTYSEPPVTKFRRSLVSQPDKLMVDLVFADIQELTAGGGNTFQTYSYRGNSPYDPDPAILTVSAQNFTTYAANYQYYCVYKSTIRTTFTNLSAHAAWCYVYPYYGNASSLSVNPVNAQFNMLPGVKKRWMDSNISGRSEVNITCSKKTNSITGQPWNDGNNCPTTAGNPALQWFWIIAFETIDGTTVQSIVTTSEIRYTVQFSGRKGIL